MDKKARGKKISGIWGRLTTTFPIKVVAIIMIAESKKYFLVRKSG